MRPVRAAALYLTFVFVGGALIAPWLFRSVEVGATFVPSLHPLLDKPFPRYVSRCLLVLALLGLRPFLRTVDLNSWAALGLSRRSDAYLRLAAGFAVGFISLACIVLACLGAGARQLSHDLNSSSMVTHFLGAVLTAACVAPLEEIFFRGALFGALRKTLHWIPALLLSSLVYALLHFLERGDPAVQVSWNSGFVVLSQMLRGFSTLAQFVPAFFNLTLAGIILGWAYQRSGSLYFSIGLHAGWIVWLKTYGFLTDEAPGGNTWFFGTSKLINGWLAFIILGAVLALVTWALRPKSASFGWKEGRILS